jgi:ABC-type Mn2+/Zn2+ transport system ATPase subunit
MSFHFKSRSSYHELGMSCDYTLNITIKNITYGYTPHKPVIENVNLLIPQGRFVGLLGPSGSGKSTLIKIIAGLFKPWSGSVQYSYVLQSGEETKKDARRNMKEQNNNYGIDPTMRPKQVVMGYVPQIETVDWNFPVTVREVVSMGIWDRSGTSPFLSKAILTEIDRILDDLGIHSHEFGKRQIRELSGGEQQRVFLARALIRKPNVLVLDEPISGVDHTTREKILGILTSLSRKGLTIILTTHDLSGIAKRLPWVVCMNKKIIAEGIPSEVLTETNLLRAFGLMVEEKNDIGLNN